MEEVITEKRNNSCNSNENRRREMINEIKSLDFSIIELGLYLDTHPEDQKALCMHREYAKQVKDLKDKYQKIYGPLTIFYPCNKWRWLEEPWPWLNLEVNNYLSVKIILQRLDHIYCKGRRPRRPGSEEIPKSGISEFINKF